MTKKELENEFNEFLDKLRNDRYSDMFQIRMAAEALKKKINTPTVITKDDDELDVTQMDDEIHL